MPLKRRREGERLSPLNGALFRGVDVLFVPGLEQERFHVLLEKAPRLRIHDVETVVVDEHRLLFEPQAPTILANILDDALADRAWEWRAIERGFGLVAAGADNFHEGLRVVLKATYAGALIAPCDA
jgi:hypothetical protein